MKTWWNYSVFVVVGILIPFIAGVLPTININNSYIGGGPIRQFTINTVAEQLPVNVGQLLVNKFMEGSVFTEVLLYLPIALNLSMFSLLFVYAFGTFFIEINNFFKGRIYRSQRKRAKGV